MPRSGALCKPWKDQIIVEPLDHPEIVGGHNYCRNPAGEEQMEEPWCFTTDRTNPKQVSLCLCLDTDPLTIKQVGEIQTPSKGLSDAYFLLSACQQASIHISYLLFESLPTRPLHSVFP